MKNFNKIMMVGGLFIASLTSCKKSTDEFIPYANSDFNDLEWSKGAISNERREAMSSQMSKPDITVNFNAATTSLVDVSNTTKLSLPANATVQNGLDYFGTINAKVKELLTKGDFVRNVIANCVSTNLQETKSAFNLSLTGTNNQSLDFKPSSKLELSFNDGARPLGYVYQTGSLQNNLLTWATADSTKGDLKFAPVNGTLHYQIKTNSTGWMAINRKLSMPNTAYTSITTQLNFTNKNTAVFAVLKNYNTVIQFASNETNKFFYSNNLPNDEPVTYIALSYLDGKFYLGFQEAVINANNQINIKTPINSISINDLNTFLNSL